MLSKPISLILVFVITVINIIVMLFPFIVVLFPFIDLEGSVLVINGGAYEKLKSLIFITAFFVSGFMLFYLALDFLFGFSVRSSLKRCVRYEKLKDFDFLGSPFDQVKKKFNQRSVYLYIKNSDEVNAYAVSSINARAIVLTRGLINHFSREFTDPKKFTYALRSIMGHEMSHLVNKDFLPSFLIIANQKATNFTSKLLRIIFHIFARIVSFTPFGGRILSYLMVDISGILNYLVTLFNRVVVYHVYELLRKFISRSIEYRCDMQSAKAFGGKNMALALSAFGEGSYFTIFSTHPATKRRILRVQKVQSKDATIYPRFFDSIANYFSLMFLMIICLLFAKQAGIDLLAREYIKNHETLHQKLSIIWNIVNKFF